ncbi:hypothetical protein [Streptomyces sp. NPDC002994]|uniref:hypothetical protein n=1 Tax=Streptomyces sp. NPDC002994 TaxID=3154441 RepID=UPI0033A46F5A
MGRSAARTEVPVGAGCTVVGAFVVLGGVAVMAGLTGKAPNPGGVAGVVIGLLIGFLGVVFLSAGWKSRHTFLCVDHTGLWVSNPGGQKVIPWDSLAGVGLNWCGTGSRPAKHYSVELYPNAPVDRDDPVLWAMVRDEEPLRPDLPRLRYRLVANSGFREPLVAAIQQYVPQLWLGEAERERGYLGLPDVKGHRERTRGRTR